MSSILKQWAWGGVFAAIMLFAAGYEIASGRPEWCLGIAIIVSLEMAYRYFTAKQPEPTPAALIAWLDEQSRAIRDMQPGAPFFCDYD